MASSLTSGSSGFPDLPDEPHHPVSSFSFLRGHMGRKPQPYDEAKDVVFCHICVKAFSMKRIKTSHNAAVSFVSYLILVYIISTGI